MNHLQAFADKLMTVEDGFHFGDRVRIKGNRTLFLVTGSEWVMRGNGETFERVHLAAFKIGTHANADQLEMVTPAKWEKAA